MQKGRFVLGIDVGSVSVDLAVLDAGGEVVASEYIRHRGHANRAVAQAVRELAAVPNVVLVAILVAILLLVSRLARSAVGFGWRLGIDPKRRLAGWLGAAQLAVAGVVLYAVTVRFLDAAPGFAHWSSPATARA